jgi:exodeoxyribonuclease V gamma subunit
LIDLVFSNSTEGLLEALAKDMAVFRHGAPGHHWEPVHLVLPSPAVKQFVFRELARPFGVVAHVQTNYLEGFWRRFLPAGPEGIHLLDRSRIQGLLLRLMQDTDILGHPHLAPVTRYLEGDGLALKRFQLAEELSKVFEGYLLGRPDWDGLWRRNQAAAADAPEELEAWQRTLWRKILGCLREAEGRWMTLPELVQDPHFAELPFPREVFIFGLGHAARAHLEAFRRLAEIRKVHLYALSPSEEAWDTFLDKMPATQDGADPFDLESEASRGGLALRRWGRPIREHVRLLCEHAGWQVREAFRFPEGETLLAALRRDLRQASGDISELGGVAPDGSLAIHACPSLRREAEVVANLVWDRILAGGARFSDVAVGVPEGAKAEYLDALRLAFAGTRQIPWTLTDEGPALLRLLVEAAGLVLNLGLSDCNRAEVLRVMHHPAFRQAWEELPLDLLPDLCERCGVIARVDRSETEDTVLEGGLWTWERGLQRAALGAFAGEEGRMAEATGELPGASFHAAEADLLQLAIGLLRDVRTLAQTRQSPSRWSDTVLRILWAYLTPDTRTAGEARIRAMESLRKAVSRLEDLEIPGLPSPDLGLREVAAFLDTAFQRLLSETLGHLDKGVVVASHASLRGIPFDTVILMGLGEGVFPGRDVPSALDLRTYRRKAGDLSRGDQDRTLFLETLLSARRSLFFTYVHRDPISGEALEPSPLLLDLRDVVRPALGEEGWQQLLREHPVHRDALGYFPDLALECTLPANHHPQARLEAEALWLGRAVRGAAGGRTELPVDPRAWGLGVGEVRSVQDRIRWNGDLGGASGARPELRIRIADLRAWLECPLQGGARLRLNLSTESEGDPALVDAEPWETPFLVRRALKRELLWRGRGGQDLEPILADVLRKGREAGVIPAGPLEAGEARQLLRTVEGWRGAASDLASARVVRFGPDRSGRPELLPVEPADPLVLEFDAPPLRVILEGRTEPLCGGESILLSERQAPTTRKLPDVKDRRDLLRAWLDRLVMTAAGRGDVPQAVRVLSAHKGQASPWTVALPPLDQDSALAQLKAWLQEALGEPRWHTMPIEGVLETFHKAWPNDPSADELATWLEKMEEEAKASFAALYGPLPRRAYDPPDPDWVARARARLGGFLGWSRVEVQA